MPYETALIVLAVLGGAFAIGAVLLIKVTRRRQATRTGADSDVVPANPMTQQQARTIARRYAVGLAVALICLLMLIALAR